MTLHYHGTPITPKPILNSLKGRAFCVSYARPDNVEVCHTIGQSVMLDNGAFSVWQRGQRPFWRGYYRWCDKWLRHWTTWAVIPDVIDGDEYENDKLINKWPFGDRGAPVWHMHESRRRLRRLVDEWPLVCIGSSSQYSQIGTAQWHRRMRLVMRDVTDSGGIPLTRLHMLRGMSLINGPYPFYSLDSTNIARNHARQRARGETALRMARRIDSVQCPPIWLPPKRVMKITNRLRDDA